MRILSFSMIIIIILLISCGEEKMNKPEKIKFRIIQTTDVHGAIFPYDLLNMETREGSLSRVHSFVNQERRSGEFEIILLDNGDILQGDPTVYYYNYEATDSIHILAEVMNYMQYDAATVGNHDIEAGHAVYDKFKKEVNFDWLAANAVKNSDGTPYFKPYKIVERQGYKVAILGLITPSIPNWLPEEMWAGMHFEDMVESAEKWIKIIQEQEKPDVVIGLFHSGVNASYGGADPNEKFNENAVKLVAEKVAGFDVIFAGHDHRMSNFSVLNPSGDSTLIVDPSSHAFNVGVVDIELSVENQQLNKKISARIKSMADIKPDSTFIYKFNLALEQVKKHMQKPVGRLLSKIETAESLFGPSAYVDFIHEAQLKISRADISFASPFTIHSSIDTGMLYERDMFKLYKFENYLYIIKMSGLEIKNALEFSYNLWISTMQKETDPMLNVARNENGKVIYNDKGKPQLANPFYNFDSGGGLIYTVNLTLEKGYRVEILGLANGKKFDLQQEYSVAMNSYRGSGGGNIITKGAGIEHNELKNRLIKGYNYDFRLMLRNWIKSKKEIKAKPTTNWQFIPKDFAEKGKTNFLLGKY